MTNSEPMKSLFIVDRTEVTFHQKHVSKALYFLLDSGRLEPSVFVVIPRTHLLRQRPEAANMPAASNAMGLKTERK